MRSVRSVGLVLSLSAMLVLGAREAQATIVRFDTALGDFNVELFDTQTPLTVQNFLSYVESGAYANSFFHRSVPGFVVQGGGQTYDGSSQADPANYPRIPTGDPVQNEPGISNTVGTIAMAKLPNLPSSATDEFFFNLGDNSGNLDNQNGGFTVFGKVLGNGMSVVNKIAALNTFDFTNHVFNGPNGGVPLSGYTQADFDASKLVQGNNLALIDSISVLGGKFTLAIASDYRLLPSPLNKYAVQYSQNKSSLELAVARNTPYVLIANNSASANITSFSLQVVDADHFIDKFRTVYNGTGVTVTRADAVNGGDQTLVFTFANPLTPGAAFTFQMDLARVDGGDSQDDFRNVLFRAAGEADVSQNAKLTVNFSDGTSLVQTLGNTLSSTQSPDLFTFSGETDPNTIADPSIEPQNSMLNSNQLAAPQDSSSSDPLATTSLSSNLLSSDGGGSLGSVATVPEPSSLVLAALGLICGGYAAVRRRKLALKS